MLRVPARDPGVMSDAGLQALGSARTEYHFDGPDAGLLEAFPNPRPGAAWIVGLDCAEFTALCPVTGQPDFGRILVDYVPDERCVESRSLKLYLFSYRNHGGFHEDCVNRIADDLAALLEPRALRVRGDFNVRGGIAIRPLAMRWGEREPDGRAGALELMEQYDRWR